MSTCATCGKCGSYLVVEADGRVYPCDFFCLDKWIIGNINESSINELHNDKYKEFLEFGLEKPENCGKCKYQKLCNGGCKNDCVLNGNKYQNYYCKSFMMLFNHAYDKMLNIARMEIMAREK